MKSQLQSLDKLILFLMGFSILVDMLNGFFLREFVKLPISQVFKLGLIVLMLLRLLPSRDILSALFILGSLQIAPLAGLLKTHDFSTYISDVIVTTKWFMVPLSFFYFKALFKSSYVNRLHPSFKRLIILSFFFLSINMILGAMGYGSAFYYDGYPNAAGTKGYIYAGNELTILVLVLAFLIASYLRVRNRHLSILFFFTVFLLFAFLITSKTVVGGVMVVFLIPYLGNLKRKFNRQWVDRIIGIVILGIPAVVTAFYYGLTRSGFLKTIQYSKEVNEGFLTILLSNRNNFVIKGWEVFLNDFTILQKIVGLGEGYHLAHAKNLAELDFITILFSNGFLGLLLLLLLILYYFSNSALLIRRKGYVYAKSVFIFLIFICLAANLAGHIFNSGIAGLYIGAAIALMFYKDQEELKQIV